MVARIFPLSKQTHLHADIETFSKADLKSVGAFRYANDKSTETLCMANALDTEEPMVWKQGKKLDDKYEDAFLNPEVLIYAHNASFEMANFLARMPKEFGIPCPDLSRFRCTMSFARRASLPAKLETLMDALGSPVKKDNRGKALIKKFCMLQPEKKPTKAHPQGLPIRRIRPEDEPEAFAEFCAYCAQDVRAEQEVSRRLAYFDSSPNNENYSLDAVINARGVPVNLVALRHAQRLIEEETEIVSAKFKAITGFNVTQNAELLKWLQPHFYLSTGPNDLQAETIEIILEPYEGKQDVPVAIEALRLKQSIAYAAIKKVATMLACAGPRDNRIQGMLNHHGASTGRWTASLVQFQNMKRPTIKWSEDAYRDICNGISRDMLELNYGPVLEVISSCIRHFVDPSDDYLL